MALAGLVASPDAGASKRYVVDVDLVTVGARDNPSAAIVPFTDAIYPSCGAAPQGSTDCMEIGAVGYRYEIGELEVTVRQWVKFLNTIDPRGRNRFGLFSQFQRPNAWPGYGQIRKARRAASGRHYRVASEDWADKPFGFADFPGAARFVNSLHNGRVIQKNISQVGGLEMTTYRVSLSRATGRGMYDLSNRATGRTRKRGFVVPSQNEWVKAAYYDAEAGEYWKYPTNPGVFGDGSATAPTPSSLDFESGDVTNSEIQPLASFRQSGLPAPAWCPSYAEVSPGSCSVSNPFGLAPDTYQEAYMATVGSVGQALTRSPWGTRDQGGNAVEWTDTVTSPPDGIGGKRIWRRLHGGVSNAPAYQMWPSAVGLQPQDNSIYKRVYPWLGFRIGLIGKLGAGEK